MSQKEPAFLFIGVYDDADVARDDLEVIRSLHDTDVIGTYDAGVVTKDDDGSVHLKRTSSNHAGWTGVAAGAVVGLLFPPSILGMAAAGGVTGGLIGHFSRSLSRSDIKELGEMLDDGQAALIVIGRDEIAARLTKAGLRAQRQSEKVLSVDSDELKAQLAEAAAQTDTH